MNLPSYSDDLILTVLSDVNIFKRLIKSVDDLSRLSGEYPSYSHIFNQPSLEKAIESIQHQKLMGTSEIEKNAQYFLQNRQVFFPPYLKQKLQVILAMLRYNLKTN